MHDPNTPVQTFTVKQEVVEPGSDLALTIPVGTPTLMAVFYENECINGVCEFPINTAIQRQVVDQLMPMIRSRNSTLVSCESAKFPNLANALKTRILHNV